MNFILVFLKLISLMILSTFIFSCETTAPTKKNEPAKNWVEIERERAMVTKPVTPKTLLKTPEFMPVTEDLSPLSTKIISLSARNKSLKDVLYIIAESTGLNLVIEKDVDSEIPIIVTFRDLTAKEVLDNVISSVNYFYKIDGNILTVKSMATKVFEFGHPSLIQDYKINVGGDILGGSATDDTSIKGDVSKSVQSDQTSFKLWESIENTISTLLGLEEGGSGSNTDGYLPSFSVTRMTGTIVVTALKKDLEEIDNYLKRTRKILNRQVMIEARIVEVRLSEGLKYGIDWTYLSSKSTKFGTSRFAEVAGSIPNFNLNVTRTDFTGLLNALQEQGDVNVLSNPRISIMNGQTALLSVGRKVDYVSKVETTTSTTTTGVVPTVTFTVETSSILSGIVFGIVPYIEGETGEITLTITPIISDLVNLEDKQIGTVGQNAVEISLPTVDLRELSTTIKVKNNDMVIIGGLIKKSKKVINNEVPFFSRLPLLGHLFKSHNTEEVRTELIVMLKPVLI